MQSWDSDINRINYEQGYISLPIILSADFRMSMADRICTHQQYIYLLYSAKWLCMDSLFQNLNKWQQVTTDTNKIKHASADTEDKIPSRAAVKPDHRHCLQRNTVFPRNRSNNTYIFMLKCTQHFQFSINSLARHKTVKDIWKFFDGDTPAIPRIGNSPTNSECKLIPQHNIKHCQQRTHWVTNFR